MSIQIIRDLNADVVKRGVTRAVYAKQYDFNSRFLNIRIQEDGKNIEVKPNLTVVLNVQRPDSQENMFYGTVNDDGTVKVPLTSWMLELAGTLVCDISIISEDPTVAKLTTMQFNVYVEESVVSDASFVETTEYSVIVDLIQKTDKAVQEATKATEELKEAAKRGAFDGVGIVNISISEVDRVGYILEVTDDYSAGGCELYINGVRQDYNVGAWTNVITVGVRSTDNSWALFRDGYESYLVCADVESGGIVSVNMTKDETVFIDK